MVGAGQRGGAGLPVAGHPSGWAAAGVVRFKLFSPVQGGRRGGGGTLPTLAHLPAAVARAGHGDQQLVGTADGGGGGLPTRGRGAVLGGAAAAWLGRDSGEGVAGRAGESGAGGGEAADHALSAVAGGAAV